MFTEPQTSALKLRGCQQHLVSSYSVITTARYISNIQFNKVLLKLSSNCFLTAPCGFEVPGSRCVPRPCMNTYCIYIYITDN